MHPIIRSILLRAAPVGSRFPHQRWIIALSALPSLGVMAAFGFALRGDVAPIPTGEQVTFITLPSVPPETAPDTYWSQQVVQRGDRPAQLLGRLNIKDPSALQFLNKDPAAREFTRLKPGRTVQAKTTASGQLLELRYEYSSGAELTVTRQGNTYAARQIVLPTVTQWAMRSGTITSSLFGATDRANVPESIATQMAEIFSSQIDFQRDLQRGDRFSVIYESTVQNGKSIKNGRILAAEFVNRGKPYRAVWFAGREGHGGYYTPDGKSLKKAFLRSPLEFSRITSRFTLARFHPILQKWKAHKGVDYSAPIGTKVKATADGVVMEAGRQNGYGNVIILKHAGNYSTVYGHLSGFARGLRRGSKVSQGEVIGYVGMTGWATGPHLHYEFRVANVPKDPLSVEVPIAFPLGAAARAQFNRTAAPLLARLDLLDPVRTASLR